jgi:class 3 adenylate cyclase
MDRSVEGLTSTVADSTQQVESLACYLPFPVLNFLVENAARRVISPTFLDLTVMFVTIIGLSEKVDNIQSDQETALISQFSHVFALINAAVEARGGVLKHVTYHLEGADMLIYFGMPNSHADDSGRAAHTSLVIRDIVSGTQSSLDENEHLITRIGITHGPVFAAEVGEQRGRREWNVLGDTVNTAARIMAKAAPNQILLSESVYHSIWQTFDCAPQRERLLLKGKSRGIPVFELMNILEE